MIGVGEGFGRGRGGFGGGGSALAPRRGANTNVAPILGVSKKEPSIDTLAKHRKRVSIPSEIPEMGVKREEFGVSRYHL